MARTLLFIHGMFLTAKSWEKWVPRFEHLGYRCLAPNWPLHDGEPGQLRASTPAGTGELSLDQIIEYFSGLASQQASPPVVIAHSLGGLVAQQLVARELASAAVCISSVAPNAMLAFDWGFFRNSAQIANPMKGDAPFEMTEKGFYENFGNKMPMADSNRAWQRYAVNESRNVLRDAMGKAGQIDMDKPHAPLLFIGGDSDQIIPPELNKKNAEAYTDKNSVAEFKEFTGRGHFICGQADWEEVADYAANWLKQEATE